MKVDIIFKNCWKYDEGFDYFSFYLYRFNSKYTLGAGLIGFILLLEVKI